MATTSAQNATVVVGYFASGDAAHRAINALVDEGFLPDEIGAAFHVGARENSAARQANVGGSLREELGTTHPGTRDHAAGSSTGGAASDDSVVQYAALGGGAGTPFDGAGRPGPISGSSLTNTGLPTELKSGLPHDSDIARNPSRAETATPSPTPNAPALRQEPVHETWGDKLKHVFGMHTHPRQTQPPESPLKAPVTKQSQDFGTGEGHLRLRDDREGYRYSQPAFEQSFSSYGVQPEHARHLSQRIGSGGAIVTVHAAARAIEAERVLEAHGGEVRFSGSGSESVAANNGDVEVFGTVRRDYSGYTS